MSAVVGSAVVAPTRVATAERQRLVFFFLLLAFLLAGAPALAEGVAATDFRGRRIELDKPAERIICLLESALTGLYMLGAEARLVGISTNIYQESVFPYYAAMDERIRERTLPTPGNWDFVNIESMVALQPDLVILWSGQEESIAALEEKGIPVFGVFIERFADIHREITALGELTGTQERAAELLAIAREELEAVERKTALGEGEAKPRVYFMWDQGPLETAGRNSTVQELIDLAGGINVAGDSELEHLIVNLENVLVWNPELIVMWCNDRLDAEDIGELSGWRSLSALRNGQVRELPDPFSCDFWTLKYIFTVDLVARWCHPDRFSAEDAEELRAGLLNKLYGGRLGELPALSLGKEDGP